MLSTVLHLSTGTVPSNTGSGLDKAPSVQIQFAAGPDPGKDGETQKVVPLNSYLNPGASHSQTQPSITPLSLINDTQLSVIFEEVPKLILTRATYKIVSYINLQPHIKTFSDTGRLLRETRDKIVTYLDKKQYPPQYHDLEGEVQILQDNKDNSIRLQLQDTLWEANLIMQNFHLMAERLLQITGYQLPTYSASGVERSNTMIRTKRSLISKVFNFIFGGDDGTLETIQVLKKNVQTLFNNDQLQERQLKELLNSHKLNTKGIQFN